MKVAIRVLSIFVLGTVIGPILIAVVLAAIPSKQTSVLSEKDVEVGRLVDAYRAKLPARHLFMTMIPPPDGRECGYDANVVFPRGITGLGEAKRAGRWSDYEGYYALDRWRNESFDSGYISAIEQQIGGDMSRFEAKFLRLCIQTTVLSNLCSEKVEKYGDSVDRYSKNVRTSGPAGGAEDRVVCLYVDGVAARNGLRLAPPFDQDYADTHRNPY